MLQENDSCHVFLHILKKISANKSTYMSIFFIFILLKLKNLIGVYFLSNSVFSYKLKIYTLIKRRIIACMQQDKICTWLRVAIIVGRRLKWPPLYRKIVRFLRWIGEGSLVILSLSNNFSMTNLNLNLKFKWFFSSNFLYFFRINRYAYESINFEK